MYYILFYKTCKIIIKNILNRYFAKSTQEQQGLQSGFKSCKGDSHLLMHHFL